MSMRDEVVRIRVRDGELAGTLIAPAPRVPGVLLIHGWGGNRRQFLQRAREIAPLRCVCLTFDLTGHAATRAQRETVTRADNLADVLAAYDFLAAHPLVDPAAMAVVGSSYGGYLAAILTECRAVAWLGLRAPALYKDADWDEPKHDLQRLQELVQYRAQPMTADANRALRACATFRGDVLLVESGCDDVVPAPVLASYRHACVDARSLSYRVIADADHALSDTRSRNAYGSILVHWLEEMMLGARGHVRSKTGPANPP